MIDFNNIEDWTTRLQIERDDALARAEAAERERDALAAEAKTIETLENILLALGVDPNGIDEIYMEQTAKGVIAAIQARAEAAGVQPGKDG